MQHYKYKVTVVIETHKLVWIQTTLTKGQSIVKKSILRCFCRVRKGALQWDNWEIEKHMVESNWNNLSLA